MGEEKIGHGVSGNPVDFLRHRPVAASEAGLHVGHGDPELHGGQGPRQCRIDVPHDDYPGRAPPEEEKTSTGWRFSGKGARTK